MGRPPGSKNKAKNGGSEAPPPETGIGHNSKPELTDDDRQILAIQWKKKLEEAEAEKDAAVAEIRAIRKRIKADLGDEGVAIVKAMMLLETEDGEDKIRAQIENAARAARWMAVPLGMQIEMFADQRAPAVDQARAAGKAARIGGAPLKPPHDPSVPQFDAWSEGWHDGQRALNDAQRRDDELAFPNMPVVATPGEEEEHIDGR